MLRYLIFITIGILLYLLLNIYNTFSIGVPYGISTQNIITGKITRVDGKHLYLPIDVFDLSVQSTGGVSFHNLNRYLSTMRYRLLPIYLGSYEKTPSDTSRIGIWPTRQFFIIDKKLYFFEQKMDGWYYYVDTRYRRYISSFGALLPKNFGDERNQPVHLVNNNASATLGNIIAVGRIVGNYYKFSITCCVNRETTYEIRGITYESMLQLRQNLETYIQFMMRPDTTLSCSVRLIEKPVNEQYQYGYELEEIQLEDTLAPENSIDSPIMCNTHKSILNVDFNKLTTVDIEIIDRGNTEGFLIGYIHNLGTLYERRATDTNYNTDFKTDMKKVLVYNGNELKYFNFVSAGSYGAVFIASSKPLDNGEQMFAVAIKIYTRTSSTNDKEIDLIQRINRVEETLCETVNSYIMDFSNPGDRGRYYVNVMEYMDGSLEKLIGLPNYDITKRYLPLHIIKSVTKHLLCLFNLNLAYTDLKLGNILYRCYVGNKMKISLGDIGSISDIPSEEIVTTYLCPEYFNGLANGDAYNLLIVWCLGLLIIRLFDNSINFDFTHGRAIRLIGPGKFVSVMEFSLQTYMHNPEGTTIEQAIEKYYVHDQDYLAFKSSLETLTTDNSDIDPNLIDILNRTFVSAEHRITLREINTKLQALPDIQPIVTCITHNCQPNHTNRGELVVCPQTGCTDRLCCVEEGEPPESEPESLDCAQFTLQEDCEQYQEYCHFTDGVCDDI